MKLAEHLIAFSQQILIHSIIQEHEHIRFHLSYDIKSTLKSYFLRENIQLFVIMYATLLWTS